MTEQPSIIANIRATQLRAQFHHELGEAMDPFGSGLSGPRNSTMPDWLVKRLDDAGWIDATTAASRTARAARCPHCRGHVIRGLTEFPMAISVDADPQPLSAIAEALCVLAKRPTYELRHLGTRFDLDHRDQWRIRGRPAGITKNLDVLARHDCSTPPPRPYAPTMLATPAVQTTAQPEGIPY